MYVFECLPYLFFSSHRKWLKRNKGNWKKGRVGGEGGRLPSLWCLVANRIWGGLSWSIYTWGGRGDWYKLSAWYQTQGNFKRTQASLVFGKSPAFVGQPRCRTTLLFEIAFEDWEAWAQSSYCRTLLTQMAVFWRSISSAGSGTTLQISSM